MGHYEWDVCPNCRVHISSVRRGVASDTTIGPTHMVCPHCGSVLKTGKTEWIDKSAEERTGYYVRVVWWCLGAVIFGWVIGFLPVFFFLGAIMKKPDEMSLTAGMAVGVLTAVLAVIKVITAAKNEVKESMKRTRST